MSILLDLAIPFLVLNYLLGIDSQETFIETRSNLNFRFNKLCTEYHIEIPFPQRDLHVRSMDEQAISMISKRVRNE